MTATRGRAVLRRHARPRAERRRHPAEPKASGLLAEAARSAACTPGQAASAWVLTRPVVDATIVGPRTVEQLRDNLGAQDVRLPEETVRSPDEASVFATRLPRT